MSIQFSHVSTPDDDFITAFLPGGRTEGPIGSTHPNFKRIVAVAAAKLQGTEPDADEVIALFDVPKSVAAAFSRLSERITVDGGVVMIDGDPVHNAMSEQVLDFLNSGEDFAPLVNFWEKLLTNPLGDVREGLYSWLTGQTSDGSKVTITADGDLIGYKGVYPTVSGNGFKPSRTGPGIINGQAVTFGDGGPQNEGDVVEMPRSTLTEPSAECGVGLHVGTWKYAKSFGPLTLAVKFNPRDVVSAPDSNSSWKLRVCRYHVLGLVDEPLTDALYIEDEVIEDALDLAFED